MIDELTRERALELHRQMWTEMQKRLGDNPTARDRLAFKDEWCGEHFPNEGVRHSCFLCEYTIQFSEDGWEDCSRCPVVWPCEPRYGKDDYFCEGLETMDIRNGYRFMPISKILSLPERDGVQDVTD